MALYVEKPQLICFSLEVKEDQIENFTNWTAKYNSQITVVDGFMSLELLRPAIESNQWMIVQRFTSKEAAANWQSSSQKQALFKELLSFIVNEDIIELKNNEADLKGGVTEVIIAQVAKEKAEEYRRWALRIHQAEAKFPGYRGVYEQSLKHSEHVRWITFLQFDTIDHLDNWLQSPQRQKILNESHDIIASLESHRVISPYAGWFSSIAKLGEMPALWKQTMLVLLVLFPIVMLELKYLMPLLSPWNQSVSTFIGNALSVSLISFPMMPIAIYCLGWWLTPRSRFITLGGTLLVLLLYAIEIVFFYYF